MKSCAEPSHIWGNAFGAQKLLFGSVKEDASVEIALLGKHGAARRIAVTASGGCTALSILASTPVCQVAALDINPAQIYASKLKLASVLYLSAEAARSFNLVDGRPYYERIRSVLEPDVIAFWDRNRCRLNHGLNHAGSVDRRVSLFRGIFHRLIHTKKFVRYFLSLSDVEEQKVLYDRWWASRRWKAGTRLAFDPRLLKAFFARTADLTLPADFLRTMRQQ